MVKYCKYFVIIAVEYIWDDVERGTGRLESATNSMRMITGQTMEANAQNQHHIDVAQLDKIPIDLKIEQNLQTTLQATLLQKQAQFKALSADRIEQALPPIELAASTSWLDQLRCPTRKAQDPAAGGSTELSCQNSCDLRILALM